MSSKETYSSVAIANFFIAKATTEGNLLSHLKLQKLVYFAHGWSLAVYCAPLVYNDVKTSKYGPIFEALFEVAERCIYDIDSGRQMIIQERSGRGREEPTAPIVHHWDTDTIDLLNRIWEVFGVFSDIQLSNMAHSEGTPWEESHKKGESHIPDEAIEKYFVDLANKNCEGDSPD